VASAPFSATFSRANSAIAGSRSSPVKAAAGRRAAICISTAPAPQPASITRCPGPAATAAASRAASMPARYPEAGWRSRTRPPSRRFSTISMFSDGNDAAVTRLDPSWPDHHCAPHRRRARRRLDFRA
jgi:hypothetical protein